MTWGNPLFNFQAMPNFSSRPDHPFVLTFQFTEVMSGRIGPTVARLMALTDTLESCLQCQERLVFQFEGFNDHSLEVHQIPECIAFFRAIHKEWPYWIHFMTPQRDSMATLLLMICDCIVTDQNNSTVGVQIIDLAQATREFSYMVNAVHQLHAHMGIPSNVTQSIAKNVMRTLEKAIEK